MSEVPETDWWIPDPEEPTPLMLHRFSGDPWGLCSVCMHPAYHPIHRDEKEDAA